MEEELASLAPRLLRYCLGRTGSRGQAEEICQESLAALIGEVVRVTDPDGATWLLHGGAAGATTGSIVIMTGGDR